MDKEVLAEKLKVILASAVSLGIKAQNYHWNVTGDRFSEYHNFFGDYYTQISTFVDMYAEHIRQLDTFAPGSLSRFSELTKIEDETSIPACGVMMYRLSVDNKIFLILLIQIRQAAEEVGEFGLVATIEDAIRYHSKMQWMLESFIKG